MNRKPGMKLLTTGLLLAAAIHPGSLWACAACYGQSSDSPLAAGMNWGIFSLMGVVVVVLGSIASFFVYLARRAAAISAQSKPNLETAASTSLSQ
jgi:hypothetical protein